MKATIEDILDNLLYWDSCPEDYKEVIREHQATQQEAQDKMDAKEYFHSKDQWGNTSDEYNGFTASDMIRFAEDFAHQKNKEARNVDGEECIHLDASSSGLGKPYICNDCGEEL